MKKTIIGITVFTASAFMLVGINADAMKSTGSDFARRQNIMKNYFVSKGAEGALVDGLVSKVADIYRTVDIAGYDQMSEEDQTKEVEKLNKSLSKEFSRNDEVSKLLEQVHKSIPVGVLYDNGTHKYKELGALDKFGDLEKDANISLNSNRERREYVQKNGKIQYADFKFDEKELEGKSIIEKVSLVIGLSYYEGDFILTDILCSDLSYAEKLVAFDKINKAKVDFLAAYRSTVTGGKQNATEEGFAYLVEKHYAYEKTLNDFIKEINDKGGLN